MVRSRIAAEAAARQGRITGIVVHPAAIIGRITVEADVRQRRAGCIVIQSAAVVIGRVTAEDIVSQGGAGRIVVHSPT